MKRLFLTIFCVLATFALGYTAYAATVKKTEKKPLSKDPKDIQERILKSHTNFLENFASTTLNLLPAGDAIILRDEIMQVNSIDTKTKNKSATSTRSYNESNILLMSKINFLNMYVNSLKNPPQDAKAKAKKVSKVVASAPVVTKPLQLSNELVHKVVTSTSTHAIQELQRDFINTNILKIKKIEIPKNKIINKVGHPAIQPPRLRKKTKIATSTEPIMASVIEESIIISTSTPTTTTSEQESVMSTSTATTTDTIPAEVATPAIEEVVTSSSTETQ